MKIIDKNTFFEITKSFDYVPFTQSDGWRAFHSIKDENRFVFFVDSTEKPTIACMGHVKKFAWLKMLQIEGECLLDEKNIASKKIREFYKAISQMGFDMVEVCSSLPYNALYEIGIREAGYLRPVGMFSSQLSNWINLQHDIRYNENWKRNLKKSEHVHLKLQVLENPTDEHISLYADFYNRFTKSKGFSHAISLVQLKKMLQTGNFSLALVSNENEQIVAGMVFYRHLQHAGLFIAARNADNTDDVGVTFFMYDRLFEYLKSNNYASFDMEKLGPSTHSKQSVFLFKNGVKGAKVLYCGEFSWYKRHIYRPLMYVVKKYLFKRVEV
ncbi:MAG: hypothetical protein FWC39_08240 [Bacteroidetes bacterium]|nr:hypothetical protein [Bacteroidota bacterium]